MAYKIKGRTIDSFVDTSLAPSIKLSKYTVDGTPLAFYQKTEPWQEVWVEDLKKYYYQDGIDYSTITYRDSLGSFITKIHEATVGDSTQTFYIWASSDGTIKISHSRRAASTTITITSADRIILLLQAAGGSGGGTSNVYAAFICIGGEDGGSGGSGGLLAVVLNTKYLKDNGGEYEIKVGGPGKTPGAGNAPNDGMNVYLGNGVAHGYDGTSGTDSTVTYIKDSKSTSLFTVGAGKGGTSGKEYTPGKPGAGGIVTEANSKNRGIFYWLLPVYDINSRHVNDGMLNGLTGGSDESSGPYTNSLFLRATSMPGFMLNRNWVYPIGGYSGGSSQGSASAGGAASWFGNGGNGGPTASSGEPGGIGAGGGGGQWSYGGVAIGLKFSAVALASIKGGGNGGAAKLLLYY